MDVDFSPTPDSVLVICYHGVVSELADPDVQTMHLPVASFIRQLDLLARAYELISLDTLGDLLRSHSPLGAPQAVISFDDGYRNVLTVAEPLLRARKIPFSVFVSTRYITTGERFPTYVLRAALYTTQQREVYLPSIDRQFTLADRSARREVVGELTPILKRAPMPVVHQLLHELRALVPAADWPAIDAMFEDDAPLDWDGLRSFRQAGAVIGSHCHDHAILHERQSATEVRYQLTESKQAIEARIGPCRYFAYPNGGTCDISPAAANLVRSCGYELGFAAVRGLVTARAEHFLLPRIFALQNPDMLSVRLVGAATSMPDYEAWRASLGRIEGSDEEDPS
jgi:peptidoglycan/xylan/chitin deacetylase (PgdA/CDA1 family)